MIAELQEAGRGISNVFGDPASAFWFQPVEPLSSPVQVLRVEDAEPPLPDAGAEVTLARMADGEVAVLPSGQLVFECRGFVFETTGPGAGGSELEWVANLPQTLHCTPTPPDTTRPVVQPDGTVVQAPANIREARIAAARDALGAQECCSEPAQGGNAMTGMMWEGVEVSISASISFTDDPNFRSDPRVSLGDGEAATDVVDGAPLALFDCGDTFYGFSHNSTNTDVHLRAAQALVEQLRCTPSLPPGVER